MNEQPRSVEGSSGQEGDPEEGIMVLRLEEHEVPGEVFLAEGTVSAKCKGLRRELAQITQGTERQADAWIIGCVG